MVQTGVTDKMPDLLRLAESNQWLLTSTSMTMNYCTCGCSDNSQIINTSKNDKNKNVIVADTRKTLDQALELSNIESRNDGFTHTIPTIRRSLDSLDTFCEK